MSESAGEGSKVEEVENYARMSDGFNLSYRYWTARRRSSRTLVCIPGGGGYAGQFRLIGQDLALAGVEVYAVDLRGFGNSREKKLPKGDVSDFKRLVRDIEEVVKCIREAHPANKTFVLGHSMGGNYALWYAANYADSLEGLVLLAPGVKFRGEIHKSEILKFFVWRIFTPRKMYNLYDKFPNDYKKTEEFKAQIDNQQMTKEFSIRYMFASLPVIEKSLQNATRVSKPTLVIQGEADMLTLPTGANMLLEKLAVKDKVLRTFPDADHHFYHALLPELVSGDDTSNRKQVTAEIEAWLNRH